MAATSLLSVVLVALLDVRPASAGDGADGGAGPGDGRASAAIIDGELADGNPQIVRLFVDWSDGAASSCTGTFVTSVWVLTAAHCLVNPARTPVAVRLESGTDWLHPHATGYWISTSASHVAHPGYSPDDPVVGRNDVALVRSSDPSPYRVPGVPYLGADLEPALGIPGALGLLYGTGLVAPGTTSDHLRYAAFETIGSGTCGAIAVGAGTIFSSDEAFCAEGVDPGGFSDPEACNGDSGGPFFVMSTDGQLSMGGVLSAGISRPDCVDSIAYFTRTAGNAPWIASITGIGPLAAAGQTPSPEPVPTPAPAPAGSGYWLLEEDGDVTAYGGAPAVGGVAPEPGSTAVAIAARPQGDGFWVLTSDGDIQAAGAAADFGAVDLSVLTKPGESVSTMSPAPDGAGLWVFTTAGRIIAFGTSTPASQMSGADAILALTLEGPIVDSVATPSGLGAYLVATDGGVFAVGDAAFHGSVRGQLTDLFGAPGLPAQPVVGVVADPDGEGYWMVAADGGVFSFRTPFRGSLPAIIPFHRLVSPVNGMVPFGNGYLLVADDGGVFNFSDQPFAGSGAGALDTRVVGVATID